MTTNTYTILMEKKADVLKKLTRIGKKAQSYGLPFSYSEGEPYSVEIKRVDDFGKKYTELYEVFDLTVNSDVIRKGNYTILARIEHTLTGNIVNTFVGTTQKEWTTRHAFCEHCNSNHGLKITFMVSNGHETKQVGRTCLKDYCGIDPQMIVAMNEFTGELEQYSPEKYDFDTSIPCVFDSLHMLAHAIKITEEQGYVKSEDYNSNKSMLLKLCHDNPSAEYLRKAEKLSEGILAMSANDAINMYLDNVQTRLKGFYCKPTEFGYFAYAPTAYARYEERKEQERRRAEANNAMAMTSEYVGSIGERKEFDVKEIKLITSFMTNYGTTFLYRFIDNNDNVLMWFASSAMANENARKIKATVKDHKERDGVKQTIITRVKVA